MPKKNKICKEDISEDYCFACKDGGNVRICDYKDCLKVYHPECVEKDDSLLHSEVRWVCDRHSCVICRKTAKYHCFCCPQAVCKHCLYVAEFVLVKGSDGFCNECLKLATLIEENLDVDSDGGRVDFKEQSTMEFLFKEYWEIIKEKQGLCAEHVKVAKISMKCKNFKCDFDSKEIGTSEDSFSEADIGSDYGGLRSEEEWMPVRTRKRSKGKLCRTKRKVKAKKLEFTGWGSKPLLQFLNSIGKDTTKQRSQKDVTTLVKNYCKDNNLFDPEKRKTVICDAILQSLLGKKSISITRIHNLLTVHLFDNLESSDDDETGNSSEDDDETGSSSEDGNETGSSSEDEDEIFMGTCKNQCKMISDGQPQKRKVVSAVQKNYFASIIADNIKLVYLKRSLVEEFLKEPETFDDKVVGSFVRVKSAPNYPKKTFHQLFLVRGKTLKNDEMNTEIFLQLFNMEKDVPVSKLSDEDLCEEECIDLHQRMKDGLLKTPTVVELEQKAKQLHMDIMKDWIARELSLLQKRIDRANEKGWRLQLEEYINSKMRLEQPAVQLQLLNKLPKVIADIENFEPIPENSPAHEKPERGGLRLAPRGSSQILRTSFRICYSEGRTDRAGREKLGATLENSASQDKEKHHDSPKAPRRPSRILITGLANGALRYSKGRTDPADKETLYATLENSGSQDREKHHDSPEAPTRLSRTPGTGLGNGTLRYSKGRTDPAGKEKLGAILEKYASQDEEKHHDSPETPTRPSRTPGTGLGNGTVRYSKGRTDPAGKEKLCATLENSVTRDKEKHHDSPEAPIRPSRTTETGYSKGTTDRAELGATLENSKSHYKDKHRDPPESPRRSLRSPGTGLANGTLCSSNSRSDPACTEKLGATLESSASQDKKKHHDSPEVPRRSSRTPRTGLANGTLHYSKSRTDPAGTEKLGATLESSASQDKKKHHDSPEAPLRPSRTRTPRIGLANGTLRYSKSRTDPAGTEKLGATLESSASQDKKKHHNSPEVPRRSSRTPRTGTLRYSKSRTDPAEKLGANLESSASQDKRKHHDSPEAPRRPSRTRTPRTGTENLGATLESSASQDKKKHHDSPEAPRRPSRTPRTGLANGTLRYSKGRTDPADVRAGNGQRELQQDVHGNKMPSQALLSKSCDIVGQKQSEPEDVQPELKKKRIGVDEVVELSGDDNSNGEVTAAPALEDPGSVLWYILSRYGDVRGPFKMSLLKHWSDTSTFQLEFRVRRAGQRKEEAIPLSDAIRQSFPCV